jgi:hypothetical protein
MGTAVPCPYDVDCDGVLRQSVRVGSRIIFACPIQHAIGGNFGEAADHAKRCCVLLVVATQIAPGADALGRAVNDTVTVVFGVAAVLGVGVSLLEDRAPESIFGSE